MLVIAQIRTVSEIKTNTSRLDQATLDSKSGRSCGILSRQLGFEDGCGLETTRPSGAINVGGQIRRLMVFPRPPRYIALIGTFRCRIVIPGFECISNTKQPTTLVGTWVLWRKEVQQI